jgi:hypothetical protein
MRPWWVLLVLLFCLQAAWVHSQTIYPGLHTDALADANFCPYSSSSPWRQKLPENPTLIPGDAGKARNYIRNSGSGRPFWRVAGDHDYDSGCQGTYCQADALMATWVATTSDPQVTITCECGNTNYGCWDHDANLCRGGSGGWSFSAYVPRNMVPGLNNPNEGDANWAVIQPNGDVFEAYHCLILSPVTAGITISPSQFCNGSRGAGFIGAMLRSNLRTDKGTNGAINSGPNAMAIGLKYNRVAVQNPQPNSAIWMNTSCNGSGFVYPATSETRVCDNPGDGLRTGAHLWLSMTHAQIDSAISAGQVNAAWRGILYAAHDYGIYLGDTGGGLGSDAPAFALGWLENAVQVVANHAHDPWIEWMQQISPGISTSTYAPTLWANPFLPFVDAFQVVADCYAEGTCANSIPTPPCEGGEPTTPPSTDCPRLPPLECWLDTLAGDPLPCGCGPGGGKKRLPPPTNVRVIRQE